LPEPKQSTSTAGKVMNAAGFDWTDLAIFMFIAVPVVAGILRRIVGRPIGSLITGAGVGALALLVTSSLFVAIIAGIVALLFALLSGSFGGLPIGRGGPWMGGGGGGWGGGGGGSGGWGGSGGGGDFGGGGASGSW